MIENAYQYDFGGFKYERHTDCMSDTPYFVRPDGTLQELPVLGDLSSAMKAIMIHAMNSNGYCP